MAQYTLHKLSPNRFIVTSDEEIQIDDIVFHLGRLQFFTVNHFGEANGSRTFIPKGEFNLPLNMEMLTCDCRKVVVKHDRVDFSLLTEREQGRIGHFNLDELADRANAYNLYAKGTKGAAFDDGYKQGFQKAIELLSDNIFTLKDAQIIFGLGAANRANGEPQLDEAIESMISTQWEIGGEWTGEKFRITKLK